VGAGLELSLIDGLQLGPVVRFVQVGPAQMLQIAVSFSIGVPEAQEQHDNDTDKDGIANNVDKCPDQAEDKDGFEDDDGCPDPDNGPDGCMLKPTEVKIEQEKIVIGDKIFFEFGKSAILSKSDELLKNVAELIKAHLEVKKVRIECHTDDVGTDDFNQKLSED